MQRNYDVLFRPLGVPHLEKVTLFNINSNKSVDMTSISGNTVHFHSSFFEDKVNNIMSDDGGDCFWWCSFSNEIKLGI